MKRSNETMNHDLSIKKSKSPKSMIPSDNAVSGSLVNKFGFSNPINISKLKETSHSNSTAKEAVSVQVPQIEEETPAIKKSSSSVVPTRVSIVKRGGNNNNSTTNEDGSSIDRFRPNSRRTSQLPQLANKITLMKSQSRLSRLNLNSKPQSNLKPQLKPPNTTTTNNNNNEDEPEISPKSATSGEGEEVVFSAATIKEVIENCKREDGDIDFTGLFKWKPVSKSCSIRVMKVEYQKHIKELMKALKSLLRQQTSIEEGSIAIEKRLADTINKNDNDLRELKTAHERLEIRNAEMQAEIGKLRDSIESSMEKKEMLFSSNLAIMEKQQTLISERIAVENEKSRLELQVSNVNLRCEQLNRDLEKLQLDSMERERDLKLRMKEQEEKYKNQENVLKQSHSLELIRMAEDTTGILQEKYDAERKLMDSQLDDKTLILQRKEERIDVLTKENEQLLQQIQSLHQEVHQAKKNAEDQSNEVLKALGGMKQAQDFAQESNDKLRSEKVILEDKLKVMEEKVVALEQINSRITIQSELNAVKLKNLEELHQSVASEAALSNAKAMESQKLQNDLQRQLDIAEQKISWLNDQMREVRNEQRATEALLQATKVDSTHKLEQFDASLERERQKHQDEKVRFEELLNKEREQKDILKEKTVSLESEIKTFKETANSSRSVDMAELCEKNKEIQVLKLKLNESMNFSLTTEGEKNKRIDELERKLLEGDAVRRKMHNMIQELRGNVRVYVRTRPFLPSDQDDDHPDDIPAVQCMGNGNQLRLVSPNIKVEPQEFQFDKVFGQSSSQEDIFEEVSEFVQSALDGYHVCLFSYGQTGSGKTHSMQGTGLGNMRGIIPRSIEKVMQVSQSMAEQGWEYHMEVSFLEIYNEAIRDLLAAPGNCDDTKYTIIQKKGGPCEVTNVIRVKVNSVDHIETLMEKASRQRSVGATDMNLQSSRSHSVFSLHLTGTNSEQGIALAGQLNLVDLAGSEKLSRSNATGERMKETQHINKSLSCLTDVFTALANKSSHVPFRNSKLTYLLQQCLSGDGKTLMMVNLSPTSSSYKESLTSLRFAQQVNKCELGKARRQVKTNNPTAKEHKSALLR